MSVRPVGRTGSTSPNCGPSVYILSFDRAPPPRYFLRHLDRGVSHTAKVSRILVRVLLGVPAVDVRT